MCEIDASDIEKATQNIELLAVNWLTVGTRKTSRGVEVHTYRGDTIKIPRQKHK